MQPYRLHVFACDQKKPEGVPGCAARGSARVIEALRRELGKAGLGNEIQLTPCGSLGLCERGPNLVIYPEGVWYSGVTPDDVGEIVREHLQNGRVVERLVNSDEGAVRTEIEGNKKKRQAALAARDAAGMLPDDFQQMVRGFQRSRVLLTAIELDVFSAVGEGARGDEVASVLKSHPRATEMLLDALVALEALTKQAGRYHNTPLSTRYLAAEARDDARAALMHTAHLWPRWSTLTECVRKGTAVTYREMTDRGDDWTEAFIAAMHRNASARAPLVARAAGIEKSSRMLDVGGGSGAYSIAFARANPDMKAEIFDLPTVVPIAQRHIDEAGLAERISTRVGDLRQDELGSGYDLILLSAICHMLGPAGNQDLVQRCYRALAPGGRLIIQDFILEPNRTSPTLAALFALNMLVGTPDGGTYTSAEYRSWLEQSGFVEVIHVRLPGPTGLMIGQHP
jgi:(2Fe-2S) ferredoxin/predicted O-methyltransferase YrrM